MVAAAVASRVASIAMLRHLTRKQQVRAMRIIFGVTAASEAALQLLDWAPWAIGNTDGMTLYCGSKTSTLWIEQSCSSNGTNHSLEISSFKTWNVPLVAPNRAKHMVDGVKQIGPTTVQAVLRGVIWNRTAQDRFVNTYYPIAGGITVVRPFDMRKPGELAPPVLSVIPGVTSKPGEEPSARSDPRYLLGGFTIRLPTYGDRPIYMPGNPPKPTDKPGEIEYPPTPIPGVRPIYRPTFIPRAVPARMEKQSKVAFSPAGAVPIIFRWLDTLSEWSDVVDALYRALPRDVRKNYKRSIDDAGDITGGIGGPGREITATHIKLQALWNNLDRLDGEQAAANLLVNAVEDMAIGETERRKGDLFNRLRGEYRL